MTTSPAQTSTAGRPLIRWDRLLSQAQDIILIFVSVIFLIVHVRYVSSGHFMSVPFAIESLVQVFIFLTRRKSRMTSTRPFDWFVAAVGGWSTLAFQVNDNGPAWADTVGFSLQVVGLLCVSFCFLNLGRSFGIVAANRGLKTRGPYQIVRHPIYACHFITQAGFLLVNPHWINFSIFGVVVFAQVMRMNAEERVLTESGDYANYAAETRYRLIPGIY